MKISSPSPIAPRRIEVSLESKGGESNSIFIDTVDENLAREVVATDKINQEVGGDVAAAAAGNDETAFTNQQQLSFGRVLEAASPNQKQRHQKHHLRRTSSDSPLLPRKTILSPSPAVLERKMTNGGGGVEPTRSALTPRSNTQANGVSSYNQSPIPSNMKEPMTIANGIPLDPRRSTKPRAASSTPPRPNSNNNNAVVNMSPSNMVRTRSFDQNRLPKNPRDALAARETAASSSSQASPQRSSVPSSNASQKSARSVPNISSTQSEYWDPESQEQALFEQRLCEDAYGVAVRKINQNGKAQLRYVKCVTLDASDLPDDSASATSKSVASLVRSFSSRKKRSASIDEDTDKLLSSGSKKALLWGKKRDHKLALDKFVGVRTGKTTERTRKNPQPASRLLSLITKDNGKSSLDIEAPTRLDRDKFARAFARFLQVPLQFDTETSNADAPVGVHTLAAISGSSETSGGQEHISAAVSAPDLDSSIGRRMYSSSTPARSVGETPTSKDMIQPGASLGILAAQTAAMMHFSQENDEEFAQQRSPNASSSAPSFEGKEFIAGGAIVSGFSPDAFKKQDDKSVVSSLTGGNYDQDIVEELHQALENLKSELEESRAEAARAVKVAEQAIQSAENSNSKDWNSTVTHKAAEAAALAQKRSAEAMAKQRLAEERLAGERKNASFWRSQAEAAEEEAGVLQTRAAAAEVQRAAMIEDLDSERQKTQGLISTLKTRFASSEVHKREALDSAIERNRALEIELTGTRRDLSSKSEETKHLQDELHQVSSTDATRQASMRKKLNMLGKGKKKSTDAEDATSLLAYDSKPSEVLEMAESMSASVQSLPAEEVLKLHAEFTAIRLQFELLKRTTSDELKTLPETSQMWAHQAGEALVTSQVEVARLRQRLALESSTRRKLLHEVQDLRGAVRVYCRPQPFHQHGTKSVSGAISLPSNEIVLLHRERLPSSTDSTALTFEFDRIFAPEMDQKEIYSEVDELVLCALDGYNVCLMAYGQTGSGKTYAMLGDVSYPEGGTVKIEKHGIHLQGAEQLFNVSKHRSERYEDSFSLSIVEVNDERLCDLVAGTDIGEARGTVDAGLMGARDHNNSKRNGGEDEAFSQMSSKSRKLEIRTSNDGETVVQGLVTVKVTSMEDVLNLWKQALKQRSLRLKEQGLNLESHEAETHVIATLKITSTNIATGVGTQGKIQFVEFAGADLSPNRASGKSKNSKTNDNVMASVGNKRDWRYTNKSMATVLDVVTARSQFNRSVPYRNSTITHLLQDALEGDAKIMMLLCVSSDPKDMQETASALRFASKMKRVNIGKATKHALLR